MTPSGTDPVRPDGAEGAERTPAAIDGRSPEHASVERLAWLLDAQFRIPFTQVRFGFDAVLGVVPGIGDAAGLAASTVVVVQAVRLGARGWTVVRMLALVLLDAVIGSIPALGTVADVVLKANTRNLSLLERHLDDADRAAVASRRSILATVALVVVIQVVLAVAVLAGMWWLASQLIG